MTALVAMFIYAFSMAITPGPNNIIALSTGVNYGFKKALPFTLGVVIGFNLLLAVIAFGIGTVVAGNEGFLEILGYGGIAFMAYMAYKIATAPTHITPKSDREAGFMHGVLFQWINPKAWTACLGGIGAFNLAGNNMGIVYYIAISTCVVLFSVSLWAYAGSKITRFLENERNHKFFNYAMGSALLAVALYVLLMDK
ncbi:MAG: LysE family translocator [Emcibacteraceae bacterium]